MALVLKPYHAVVMPYLAADWENTSDQRTDYHPYKKRKRNVADPAKTTYIGSTVFTRQEFDFLELRVVSVDSSSTSQEPSPSPNVGKAWISENANIDSYTGALLGLLSADNQGGSYTYYPRTQKEDSGVAEMQYRDAEQHAGLLSRLPYDFRQDLIGYLMEPDRKKPHTYALAETEKMFREMAGTKISEEKTQFAHITTTTQHMAVPLSNTCRLLNDEVKKTWLMRNIFLFYDPQQLVRFLKSITPGATLLQTWPRKFNHVVINIKSLDPEPCRLRIARHTAIVPLKRVQYPGCATKREEDRNDNSDAKEGGGMSLTSEDGDFESQTTAVLQDPMSGAAPSLAPLERELLVWEERLAQQRLSRCQAPTSRDQMKEWLQGIQAAMFVAHEPHGLVKGLPVSNVNVDRLLKHKEKHDTEDKQMWQDGIRDLLTTYMVGRLDIVYDRRDEGNWEYSAGEIKPKGLGSSIASEDAVETFFNPTLEAVDKFIAEHFGVLAQSQSSLEGSMGE